MANTQHIQWLTAGVESWNARRAEADLWPNFDDANIPAAFQGSSYDPASIYLGTILEGINLKGASFRQANLNGLGLKSANLQGAQLQNSHLWHTDLREANLHMANFSGAALFCAKLKHSDTTLCNFIGANLSGADLQDTDLSSADLTNANLIRAKIAGANISRTRIVGADITDTQPWKADTNCRTPDCSEKIENVGSLVAICRLIRDHYAGELSRDKIVDDSVIYFRGEQCNTWRLCPSVMRTSPPDAFVRRADGAPARNPARRQGLPARRKPRQPRPDAACFPPRVAHLPLESPIRQRLGPTSRPRSPTAARLSTCDDRPRPRSGASCSTGGAVRGARTTRGDRFGSRAGAHRGA